MQRNGIFDEEKHAAHSRYFSADFKKKRVNELEKNLVTIPDICKTYNVSRTSVYRWLYKYSDMAQKQVRQVVETKSDTRKIQLLEERIRELEQVIGKKQLLIDFQDKMIEIAEHKYAIDIKKKSGSMPSSGTCNPGTNTNSK